MSLVLDDTLVLQNALDTWGYDAQLGMANEELAELITAINQWKRGRITKEQLASEVADSFIMVTQMAIMVGEELVQDHVLFKVNRLKQRLEDYNAPKGLGIREV
jgi:NTP pyrophosphatase (non-canonical NTP hydrolase)